MRPKIDQKLEYGSIVLFQSSNNIFLLGDDMNSDINYPELLWAQRGV